MMTNPLTGELESLDFEYIHQQIPEINRLALDVVPISITNPIDSSQMQPNHWIEMVALIAQHHAYVDGIVILHGTDTMALTAQYCFDRIKELSVPVVFTGAMIPMGFEDTDATQNVTEAMLAAKLLKPGFYISFHNQIFVVPNVQKNKEKRTFEEI